VVERDVRGNQMGRPEQALYLSGQLHRFLAASSS
jgi:hypothetical protein